MCCCSDMALLYTGLCPGVSCLTSISIAHSHASRAKTTKSQPKIPICLTERQLYMLSGNPARNFLSEINVIISWYNVLAAGTQGVRRSFLCCVLSLVLLH